MADESNKKKRKQRSERGLHRELRVVRDTHDSDPSRGGSKGYPLWFRLDCIERVQNVGLEGAAPNLKPCLKTLENWMGRITPYEMIGGRERTALVGRDQLLLTFYFWIYPDAELDEAAAFIVNNGGDVYSRQIISKRLKELRISGKVASVEAFQAFYPQNILKKERFFNLQRPMGVNGVSRALLIDADECGVSLEKTNRKKGRAHTSIRVRKRGHYTKGRKVTVILFVEPGDPNLPAMQDGSITNPRRWFYLFDEAGTTEELFAECVEDVLQTLETSGNADDKNRVLLWDNLRSHLTDLIYNTVYVRNDPQSSFDITPRPPYMPKYGPTEYIFAELSARLQQRSNPEWTFATLKDEIRDILSNLGRNGHLNRTFEHCGY